MVTKILQTVPICPDCQAMMVRRHTDLVYYCCSDCKKIVQVVGVGAAENELIVTDGKENE